MGIEFSGSIGHLDGIESPWANAGGVARTIEDVQNLSLTGVGWIEVGSYTLEPRDLSLQEGEETFVYDPATGISQNKVSMQNKGLDVVETEIPEMVRVAHASNKPLVVNVAPVSNSPASETEELVSRSYEAGADAVLVNAGCPHVIDEKGQKQRELSYRPLDLNTVLKGLKNVTRKYNPVFVRLSPYGNKQGHMRLSAAQAVWTSGTVSAVFTPNSWKGISGPATADETAIETEFFVRYLKNTGVDTVRSGGVTNAQELKRSLLIGAVAAAGSTFFFNSRNWKEDVDKLLSDLAVIESL